MWYDAIIEHGSGDAAAGSIVRPPIRFSSRRGIASSQHQLPRSLRLPSSGRRLQIEPSHVTDAAAGSSDFAELILLPPDSPVLGLASASGCPRIKDRPSVRPVERYGLHKNAALDIEWGMPWQCELCALSGRRTPADQEPWDLRLFGGLSNTTICRQINSASGGSAWRQGPATKSDETK
jgi:hypothetical protein